MDKQVCIYIYVDVVDLRALTDSCCHLITPAIPCASWQGGTAGVKLARLPCYRVLIQAQSPWSMQV